jgi:hypothetical protein
MVPVPSNRRIAVAVLLLAVILFISLTATGATLQRMLYVSYGLAVPVMFGLFVLASIYFGVRHLLTA